MIRTEVYLKKEQRKILVALKKRTGKSIAEHIRLAIDRYIEEIRRKYDNEN
jgi:predicted DNA-binding protein